MAKKIKVINIVKVFNNKELELEIRTIRNDDGSISINAEDNTIGFSWCNEYIPENLFYMLGMTNKTALKFKKWLAYDVIPDIRKHGAYIGVREIDKNHIDNKVRFSNKRTINTFANSNDDDIKKLVNEFVEYAETLDTKTRIIRCKSAIKGLERLHDKLGTNSLNVGDCHKVRLYIERIMRIQLQAENRRRGQIIGHKNKKIKVLTKGN